MNNLNAMEISCLLTHNFILDKREVDTDERVDGHPGGFSDSLGLVSFFPSYFLSCRNSVTPRNRFPQVKHLRKVKHLKEV